MENLSGEFLLEIYEISGKLVRKELIIVDSGLIKLDRKDLSNGQYILRLNGDQDSHEIPFVVN